MKTIKNHHSGIVIDSEALEVAKLSLAPFIASALVVAAIAIIAIIFARWDWGIRVAFQYEVTEILSVGDRGSHAVRLNNGYSANVGVYSGYEPFVGMPVSELCWVYKSKPVNCYSFVDSGYTPFTNDHKFVDHNDKWLFIAAYQSEK